MKPAALVASIVRQSVPASLAGAIALLAGCAGHQAPTFRVIGAEAGPASPDATVLLVTIEGANPNPDPLPLYSIRYRAVAAAPDQDSASAPVFAAERSPERTIPRFGTASFTVPVVIPNDRLLTPTQAITLTGSVVYQVPGTIAEVFFDNDIRRPSAPVAGGAEALTDATVAP